MGIKDFFKLIKGESVKLTAYRDKVLAFDALLEIYRANYGMSSPLLFDGIVTSGVSTIFNNVLECRKLGITPIYIFDNQSCALKSETVAKRTAKLTKYMVSDAKRLLCLMGVDIIIAPEGYEAEHLGARLVMEGTVDALVTRDADAIMFGCPIMLKKEKGKNFTEYKVNNILENLDITIEDLRKIGVALGCDFAPKVKGIGVKTVLKKYTDIKFTERQQDAIDYFSTKVPDGMTIDGNQDYDTLFTWLTTKLGFSKTIVAKKLNRLDTKGIKFT